MAKKRRTVEMIRAAIATRNVQIAEQVRKRDASLGCKNMLAYKTCKDKIDKLAAINANDADLLQRMEDEQSARVDIGETVMSRSTVRTGEPVGVSSGR